MIDYIKKVIIQRISTVSYSLEGEDIILESIFLNKRRGFFVDVGAHHPKRFSNTYKFYLKGWRGINIDPMPGSMEHFNKIRDEDINLEVAISDKIEELEYHIFNEHAINTFSKEFIRNNIDKEASWERVSTLKIKTRTLADTLDAYLPRGKLIDFLSIDVEGMEYTVLISNNWGKFIPTVVIVEELNKSITEVINGDIYKYLEAVGYVLYAKTKMNSIYLRRKDI
jgi:FkbM family methyltransferase